MIHMFDLLEHLLEEAVELTKNSWVRLTNQQVADDPAMLKAIFDLMMTAYKDLPGGHVNIHKQSDLLNSKHVFDVNDTDGDGKPNVVIQGRWTRFGIKGASMGHDGSMVAKLAMMGKAVDLIKQPGYFTELSPEPASLILRRPGIPYVADKESADKVLFTSVDWIGELPNGKFPNYPAWYKRDVGSGGTVRATKILLGHPAGIPVVESVEEEGMTMSGNIAGTIQPFAMPRRRCRAMRRARMMLRARGVTP